MRRWSPSLSTNWKKRGRAPLFLGEKLGRPEDGGTAGRGGWSWGVREEEGHVDKGSPLIF